MVFGVARDTSLSGRTTYYLLQALVLEEKAKAEQGKGKAEQGKGTAARRKALEDTVAAHKREQLRAEAAEPGEVD
jgi:hypothetical protein